MQTMLGSRISETQIFLSVPDGMLLGILTFLLSRLLIRQKQSNLHMIAELLLFTYIGALVSLTVPLILPAGWNPSLAGLRSALESIEYQPLRASETIYRNCRLIGDMSEFYRLVGGNFIMLMPLGVLVPILWQKIRLRYILLLSVSVPFAIETLQLAGCILSGDIIRTVEIDDFIFNCLGCVSAYLLWRLCCRFFVFFRKKY